MATRDVDPGPAGPADPEGGEETDDRAMRRARREARRQEREPQTAAGKVGGLARELLIVVVGALIVSSLIRAFAGQMFIIPSGSMENTLMISDRVVAEKITDVHRGEIVVFADPGQWLNEPTVERGPVRVALEFIGVLPNSETGYLIKRVIGMPGDVVECCDSQGRLMVNGVPLDETSYLYSDPGGPQVEPSLISFRVVVPADRIFVMGDHRNASADSRCHLADVLPGEPDGMNAFVPLSDVVGSAVAIVAPFDRFSRLLTPATFAQVPDPTAPPPTAPTIEPAGVHC